MRTKPLLAMYLNWNSQMNWKLKSIKFHYQIQSNALLTGLQCGGGRAGRSRDSGSLPEIPAPCIWASASSQAPQAFCVNKQVRSAPVPVLLPFCPVRSEQSTWTVFTSSIMSWIWVVSIGFFNFNLCMCVYGGWDRRAVITREFKEMFSWARTHHKNVEIKESHINWSGLVMQKSWSVKKKTLRSRKPVLI